MLLRRLLRLRWRLLHVLLQRLLWRLLQVLLLRRLLHILLRRLLLRLLRVLLRRLRVLLQRLRWWLLLRLVVGRERWRGGRRWHVPPDLVDAKQLLVQLRILTRKGFRFLPHYVKLRGQRQLRLAPWPTTPARPRPRPASGPGPH